MVVLATALVLTSPAFSNGGTIPKRYTCDGANISPALRWTAAPRGTASFSLTVFDPDAPNGGFLHWRIARLPATARSLPAGSKLGGPNGAGERGHTRPCPPSGTHPYPFQPRAVNRFGRVLASALLVGLYRRS